MRRRRQRASLAARRHCEPLQRVRGDVGVPRAHLAPRDVAVAVRVETDRVVEVAQRDVPLAAQRRSVALDRQIGVAGLVRERRRPRRARRRAAEHCGSSCAPLRRRRPRRLPSASTRSTARRFPAQRRRRPHAPRRRGCAGRPVRAGRSSSRAQARARRAQSLLDVETKARLLAPVQAVAAALRGVEAGREIGAMRDERVACRRNTLLGERQAQQQRIVAGVVRAAAAAPSSRPVAVEQEIGVCALQVGVARIERECVAEVPLRGAEVAAALRRSPPPSVSAHSRKIGAAALRRKLVRSGSSYAPAAAPDRLAGTASQPRKTIGATRPFSSPQSRRASA